MRKPRILAVLAAVLALGLWGCRQQPAPAPEAAAPERVENPRIGVAIAAVPGFFRVAVNQADLLELAPRAAGETGRLVIVAGEPETGGINLVQAVKDHEAQILERPGGKYGGQRELGTHLGTAFYSRGRFEGDRGPTEETVVFLVHPRGDRTLQLIYSYPAGDAEDTKRRLEDQLFEVLGEIEPLEVGPEEEQAAAE